MIFRKKKKYEFLPLEATTKEGKKKLKKAEKLESTGHFKEAADLYREISMFSEAKELYKRAGAYRELGDLLLEEGDRIAAASFYEKAGDKALAAKLYEESGKYLLAAKLYMETGDTVHAAELFYRGGEFQKAGDLFFRNGLIEKAIEAYERSGQTTNFAEAVKKYINNAVKSGEIDPELMTKLQTLAEKGGEIFFRTGKFEDAAKLYLFAGKYREAGMAFEKAGNIKRAIDMYLKGNDKERAATLLAEINQKKESEKLKGELYLEKGQLLEAVKAFTNAEEYIKAALIWEELGKRKNAADMYYAGKEYIKAAELYAEEGEFLKAAESFERGGALEKAIQYYRKSGEIRKAIHLYEKMGNYFEAGELYYNKGLTDKAIKAFQKIQPDDPHYRSATFYLARLFEEKGIYNLAVEKYKILTEMKGEKNEFYAEVYYRLGTLEEKLGNISKAREYFEKVNAYVFDYKDVSVKLQHLKEKEKTLKSTLSEEVDVNASTVVISHRERFRIIEEIGKGGMGIVYKAEDTLLERIVALKKLPPQFQRDQRAISRFIKEAKAAAILNHPNIVTLYDLRYEPDGTIYIAMEYVEGKTLKQILNESGPFPVSAVILIFGQVAKGLGYAHKKGIVHRDIKPSNIMWTSNKEVKIMDFGLAAAISELRDGVTTTIVGTPYYMSPEQALGNPVDHRTDIYSLGITIYELLTGRPPFKEGDLGYHHIHTPPPPPTKFNPSIPKSLEAIILKCIEKDPDNRYQSTEEILEDLKKVVKQ